MIIGLASGVTANEAYKSGGKPLTIVGVEPAIVEAATYFHYVNERIFEKPDVEIRVADARAILARENTMYDVIVSEPSNPWITGVSNLLPLNTGNWDAKRLLNNGVFGQWVQLYALPPEVAFVPLSQVIYKYFQIHGSSKPSWFGCIIDLCF